MITVQFLREFAAVYAPEEWAEQLAKINRPEGLIRFLARKLRDVPLAKLDTDGTDFRCAHRLGDFMKYGAKYKNCLGFSYRHMAACVAHRAFLVEHVAEPRCVILLEVSRPANFNKHWVHVVEIKGPRNRFIGNEQDEVIRKLNQLPEIRVTKAPFNEVLQDILRRERRKSTDDEIDELELVAALA